MSSKKRLELDTKHSTRYTLIFFMLCAMLYALCLFEVGVFMTSYLVRIYRKAENNPHLLVGVVEEAGIKEKRAFHNLYELWDILNPVKRTRPQIKRNKNSKRTQNMKHS